MKVPNTQDVIAKLRKIKVEKGYTNQYVADMTGVPKGSVDRVFAGRNTNFKYDTLQPIVRFMLGFDDGGEDTQPLPADEMMELYRNIIEAKNKESDLLTKELEQAREDADRKIAFLKKENEEKTSLIAELRKSYRIYRVAMFVLMAFICALFMVDLFISGIGWFRW